MGSFLQIILFLSCLLLFLSTCEEHGVIPVDVSKTYMWGPGLNADFQLPTRYFYLQTVDKGGDNMTESAGEVTVKLTDGWKKRPAHATVKVYDRQDGSYIVNFRPLSPLTDVLIDIKIGDHGEIGPVQVDGHMYQEGCNCPMDSSVWTAALHCPESFPQLDHDLEPFPEKSIDMREVEKIIHEKFPKRPGNGALMHYIVKDNKIYRKDIGSITGFKMFSDSILHTLARKIKLPDVEFFINLGDWPLVKKTDNPYPIISWCGSDDTHDIILPTYDVTDATLKSAYGVALDLLSIQGHEFHTWREKAQKGLFRGRDSRRERIDLALLARKGNNSELLDVGITAYFFFPKDEALQTERISFFDYFKYKYQINVDGTVAAYRLPYLYAGGSLVLKQESPFYEHFYHDLEPWKHYVPLKRDLSDVLEKIQWAKDNDGEKYAERLKSPVEVMEDMEEAHQPTYMANCDCQRSDAVHDEL